jgi:hypothetical protein
MYLASCLAYGVVDTLFARNAPVGIHAFMRFCYLLMIHESLMYPEVRHVMPYHFLRRFMCSYVIPQVLHGLVLISFTHADARPRLRNRHGAHRHNQTEN